MNAFKKLTASLLVVCFTSAALPMQASAAIVSTQEASSSSASVGERERVIGFLSREDVRKSIEAQGVNPQDALDRVQAMSDQEVQQLAGRIDQLPAGGDILGVLFTVFIVLLVTDILGLTKVFPFTRSIR
jgi:hypothetical protein